MLVLNLLKHIFDLEEFTLIELEETSGIKYQSINRLMKTFINNNVILKVGKTRYRIASMFCGNVSLKTLFNMLYDE